MDLRIIASRRLGSIALGALLFSCNGSSNDSSDAGDAAADAGSCGGACVFTLTGTISGTYVCNQRGNGYYASNQDQATYSVGYVGSPSAPPASIGLHLECSGDVKYGPLSTTNCKTVEATVTGSGVSYKADNSRGTVTMNIDTYAITESLSGIRTYCIHGTADATAPIEAANPNETERIHVEF
jgi:hypothetical protein